MPQRNSIGRFTTASIKAPLDQGDLESEDQEEYHTSGTESRSEEESLGSSSRTTSPLPILENTETMDPIQRIGLPKPPTFDGTGSIDAFANKFNAYIHLATLTEEQAIERLPFSLTGDAYDEYFRLWRETQPLTIHDAIQSLLTTFSAGKQDAAEWTSEYKLWQDNEQTVEEYLRTFRKEQDKYDGPIADVALRSSFIKGLKPKIAKLVHAAHPTCLVDAVAKARTAEREVRFGEERKKEWALAHPTKDANPVVSKDSIPTVPRMYPLRTDGAPRFPMGGAPPIARYMNNAPRFPMGGATNTPRPQLPVPRPIIEEDAKMEELLKQFQQVRIGTTEHAEWQRWAMTEGRCLKCMRKGHISRMCPGFQHVRSITVYKPEDNYEYTEEDQEYDCDAVTDEQDPLRA
jgi:hypothetical protein